MLNIYHIINDPNLDTGGGEAYVLDRWRKCDTSANHFFGVNKPENVDWVILHGIYKFKLFLELSRLRLRGIKCGVFLHGGTLYTKQFGASLLRRVYTKLAMRFLNIFGVRVWCSSKQEVETIRGIFKNPELIHFGIDDDEILELSEIRRRKLQGSGIIRYLIVGRISPVKRVLEIIEALLQSQHDHFEITIIGLCEKSIQIPSYIKAHPQCKFMGYVPHSRLYSFYESCDVYLHPSISENYSFTTRLAVLAGMPCIISENNPWNFFGVPRKIYKLPNDLSKWPSFLTDLQLTCSDVTEDDLSKILKTIPRWCEFSEYLKLTEKG